MKLFEKILMASEDVKSFLVSGVNHTDAPIADGSLVAIGDLVDHEVYTGIKDYNTHEITPYAAGAALYGVVDYVGVETATLNGSGRLVKEGYVTAGLPVPVGEHTRVRVLKKHDEFFLGADNFDADVAENKYAVPGANGMWTPQATAATSGLCVKIEFGINKIVGQVNDGKKYFCSVISE